MTATTVVAWGDGYGGRWERHCHWGWGGGVASSSSGQMSAHLQVSHMSLSTRLGIGRKRFVQLTRVWCRLARWFGGSAKTQICTKFLTVIV